MMKYTCKKCCNIMESFSSCPICNEEIHVVPIEINIQKGTSILDSFHEE